MKKHIFAFAAFVAFLCMPVAAAADDSARVVGGDISLVPAYEEAGDVWLDADGNPINGDGSAYEDGMITYLHEVAGWNAMRVRLLVDPTQDDDPATCQDLDYVKELGKRIKKAGMNFLLDIFYSDTWTDVSAQWIPADWGYDKNTATEELATKVKSYTTNALDTLVAYGAKPDYIQIGNEVSYGMLWDKAGTGGESESNAFYPSDTKSKYTSQISRFATLLTAAAKGVRASNAKEAKIVLHSERTSEAATTKNFYDWVTDAGFTDYDIIGLSYYPMWQGSLSYLSSTLKTLTEAYADKEIHIVETAYYNNSNISNVDTSVCKWDLSPAGQAAFLSDLINTLANYSNVTGLYYWQPEECGNGYKDNASTVMSNWDNRGFWELIADAGSSHKLISETALLTLKDFLTATPDSSSGSSTSGEFDASDYFTNLDLETYNESANPSTSVFNGWTIENWAEEASGNKGTGPWPENAGSGNHNINNSSLGTVVYAWGSFSNNQVLFSQTSSQMLPAGTYQVSAKAYAGVADSFALYISANEETKTVNLNMVGWGLVEDYTTESITLTEPAYVEIGIKTVSAVSGSDFYVSEFSVTGEFAKTAVEEETVWSDWTEGFQNLDFEECKADGSNDWANDDGVVGWTINYGSGNNTITYGNSGWAYNTSRSGCPSYVAGGDNEWYAYFYSESSISSGTSIIYQTSSSALPAGSYKLSAQVYTAANNVELYAKDANGNDLGSQAVSTGEWDSGVSAELSFELAEGKQVEIGIRTSSSIGSSQSGPGGQSGSVLNFWCDDFKIYDECCEIEITSAGYATYFTNCSYIMPDGLTGMTATDFVSGNSDAAGALTLNEEYLGESADVVPQMTALLIKGSEGTYFAHITSKGDGTGTMNPSDTTNLLYGSATATKTNVDGNTTDYYFYKFSYDSSGENLGFYWDQDGGAAFDIAAHRAWLAIDKSSGVKLSYFSLGGDDTTGITSVETPAAANDAVYTLQGIRVNDMSKPGIYIVGGKKVIVK